MSGTYRNINKPQKVKLSPPWFTVQRLISFSIGQSSQVMVSDATEDQAGNYEVTIVTFDNDTAQALANLVKSLFSFGDVSLKVYFTDRVGNKYNYERKATIEDLKIALHNNPLVYDVSPEKIACLPTVVQFWNDDASNPDGFTSELAADAFNEVVVDGITSYIIGRKLINN